MLTFKIATAKIEGEERNKPHHRREKTMAKTTKVMEVTIKNTTYLVIKDNTARFNPYKVYRKWYGTSRCGYGCTWHRAKVTEYADIESVFHLMTDVCRTPDGFIAFTKDGVAILH